MALISDPRGRPPQLIWEHNRNVSLFYHNKVNSVLTMCNRKFLERYNVCLEKYKVICLIKFSVMPSFAPFGFSF